MPGGGREGPMVGEEAGGWEKPGEGNQDEDSPGMGGPHGVLPHALSVVPTVAWRVGEGTN